MGAAAPSLPQALVQQLAAPGRIFIPVGSLLQYIELIDKDSNDNVLGRKRVMGVRVSHFRFGYIILVSLTDYQYVPLTDRKTQLGGD